MKSPLFIFVVVLVLSLLAAAPSAAAPIHSAAPRDLAASPCAAGGGYSPSCDVNHDGVVNVLDVQLTAGHWNQTGAFLSDNDHTHLGQTWLGASNPLKIQGAFGAPDYTPLLLNNTAGVGLSISASDSAVYIDSAGYHGLWVASAGGDGLRVNSAVGNGVRVDSASNNGMFVGLAGYDGVYVNSAGNMGVYVNSAGNSGMFVGSAGNHGVYVGSAVHDGVYVSEAGSDGVDATGTQYAGNFRGNITVSGNCIGCLQANFGINAGDRTLHPGDIVSVQGVTTTDFDTGPDLWQIAQAQPSQAIVGVVSGRAELVTEEEHRPSETGKRLVPREGAAQPGEYVTVVYSGPMQVKVAPGESAIAAGTRLTAAADGAARALGTIRVQLAGGEGTADMVESAPIVGVALEAAKDGMVWVLVNPQ